VAARCSYLCGDQPGWTTSNDHEIIVTAARVLPVRRVALVNCALAAVSGYKSNKFNWLENSKDFSPLSCI
jgi:hypothetical protein